MNQIISLFILSAVFYVTVCESAYIPLPYYTYHGSELPPYTHAISKVPAITSTSSNILRTPGNLGQISTYHKAIDTPYSSVRKADIRISNDVLTLPATAFHLAAPVHIPTTALHHVSTPVHAVHAAPVAFAYSAAPAVTHLTFDGFGTHYDW